jgi:hypothetical protein
MEAYKLRRRRSRVQGVVPKTHGRLLRGAPYSFLVAKAATFLSFRKQGLLCPGQQEVGGYVGSARTSPLFLRLLPPLRQVSLYSSFFREASESLRNLTFLSNLHMVAFVRSHHSGR